MSPLATYLVGGLVKLEEEGDGEGEEEEGEGRKKKREGEGRKEKITNYISLLGSRPPTAVEFLKKYK